MPYTLFRNYRSTIIERGVIVNSFKSWLLFLLGEAAVCLTIGCRIARLALFPAASWPILPLGSGLRTLSLAGEAGNIAAWGLYLLLGVSPLLFAAWLLCRRRLRPEDGLCAVVLCGLLLWALYAAINPQELDSIITSRELRTIRIMQLNMTCLSVLFGWIVLRAIRLLMTGATADLLKALRLALPVVSALAVAEMCLFTLPQAFRDAAASEGLTAAMTILRGVSGALPETLLAIVMLRTAALLSTMRCGKPTPDTSVQAAKLSRLCGISLAVSVLVQALANALQVALLPWLNSTNVVLELPVFPLLLMLLALCLCALLRKNQQLSEENDLFV